MSIRDLVSWNSNKKDVPVRRERREEPFRELQRRVNSLFEDFWSDFGLAPMSAAWMDRSAFTPRVEVKETEDRLDVSAELPGMTEKDVEVVLTDGTLTLKGEKREEKKEEHGGVTYSECSYGSFQRSIPLSCEIEEDKVKAEFKNGVLTVTLPKTAKARAKTRRIEVKRG